MSTVMGNSGFEYNSTCNERNKWGGCSRSSYNIIDSTTKKTLFSLNAPYTEWSGRGTGASSQSHRGGIKTILGKDEKYYYIDANNGLQWGIVQTSGVVLKSDRSVLTTINMHPLYETRPQVQLVPSIKPKPIPTPIITTVTPKVTTTVTPKVTTTVTTKPSLLVRIINWLEKIFGL